MYFIGDYNYEPRIRPWYKNAHAAWLGHISEPYFSAHNNLRDAVSTLCRRIVHPTSNTIFGVICFDIDLKSLQEHIRKRQVLLKDHVNIFLIHPETLNVITHNKIEFQDQSLKIYDIEFNYNMSTESQQFKRQFKDFVDSFHEKRCKGENTMVFNKNNTPQ